MGSLLFLVSVAIMATGCGSSNTYPNFGTLAAQALPAAGGTAALLGQMGSGQVTEAPAFFSSPAGPDLFATPTSTYTKTSATFTAAFAASNHAIGQVMLDYASDTRSSTSNTSGPVKSLFVVLASAQSSISQINEGSCTAIPSTTTVKSPFWNPIAGTTAGTASFNVWVDTGKYTCYQTIGSSLVLFGKHAIAAPTAGCTDAFEYYIMDGYSVDDGATSAQDVAYGATNDLSISKKFYYNGCTKDFKLNFAHYGKYSGGSEFSSRFEVNGNSDAKTFKMRSQFIDGSGTGNNTHTTFAGMGTSKGTSSAPVYFPIGYRVDTCTGISHTCPAGTSIAATSFCAGNAGTTNSYTATAGTSCLAATRTEYEAIVFLEAATDLPSGYFVAGTTASYGL